MKTLCTTLLSSLAFAALNLAVLSSAPLALAQAPSADATASPGMAATTPAAAKPAAAPASAGGLHLFGKKREEYTGPTEIVVLAPTPMLDEEGKQQLDPDGKPMFNAPAKQQRDKFGHPLFDGGGKPVFQTKDELGFDEAGKKLHAEKVKPPKLTPVTISRGTLVVDGMVAKAALNYSIADLQYIYLSVPGVGIAVVGGEPFQGATEQKAAFNGTTLTVKTGDHVLELTSDVPLLGKQGKGKEPEQKSAYVLVDRQFKLPTKAPVVGYGFLRRAPYVWPGSKQNGQLAGVEAPPVPLNMLPALQLSPCPAGQMRRRGPAVLPGQTAPVQPCIPIPSTQATKGSSHGVSE